MKKTLLNLFCLTAIAIIAASCNKDEGPGGTACIEGRVFQIVHDDDHYPLIADTLLAVDQDVYLVYGDDTYFGDDTETDEDGTYRFRYLTPGKYTLYAYSQSASGEKTAVKKEIVLHRGEHLQVEDLYINNGKAYGTSMIKGWVWGTYFDKNGNTVRNTWAYDHRVYIQRVGEEYYFNDTRVGLDGIYYFQKLLPGSYVVFSFSQYLDETLYPVSDTIFIDQAGMVYEADTLNIRIKS